MDCTWWLVCINTFCISFLTPLLRKNTNFDQHKLSPEGVLLFRKNRDSQTGHVWPQKKIDYVLLPALRLACALVGLLAGSLLRTCFSLDQETGIVLASGFSVHALLNVSWILATFAIEGTNKGGRTFEKACFCLLSASRKPLHRTPSKNSSQDPSSL